MSSTKQNKNELLEENKQLRDRLNKLEQFHNKLLRSGTEISLDEAEEDGVPGKIPNQNKFELLKRKVDQHLRTFALSARTRAWEDSAESINMVIHELELLQIESELERKAVQEENETLYEVERKLKEQIQDKEELLISAGAEMARLEELLKIIFESVPIGLFITDEKGVIVDHNLYSSGFFSAAESAFIDKTFSAVLNKYVTMPKKSLDAELNNILGEKSVQSLQLELKKERQGMKKLTVQLINYAVIAMKPLFFFSVRES